MKVVDKRMIPIANVNEGTRHGVVRNKKGGPEAQVEHNISTARKAAYSLMGAGLHGKNGLPQRTYMHLYQIYITPVLTYGLFIFNQEEKHTKPLEQFQKSMIKQILSLADNTGNPAVYFLSGAAPLEYELHRQVLSLFGSVTRHPESAEHQLAKRQLLMEDYSPGTTSPAIFMQQILFSSYYISITLMASQWVNMAGQVLPGLFMLARVFVAVRCG